MRELLGSGEVATTRQGFDPLLQRDVVIKLLPPHILGTSTARRMEREGRALAWLNHPAIPTVIGIVQVSITPIGTTSCTTTSSPATC